jgi:hypothetical protein
MEKLLLLANLILPGAETPHQTPAPVQTAAVCFFKGEQMSGFNRICYYDCLGSAYAITVKATDLCPLTLEQ